MGLSMGLFGVVVVDDEPDDEPDEGGNRELNHSSTTSEASPLERGRNASGFSLVEALQHGSMS
jgi:hypothetical protein